MSNTEPTARQARDLRRRARRLHEGETVKIPTRFWNAFYDIQHELNPRSACDWRCVFRDGMVEITELTT